MSGDRVVVIATGGTIASVRGDDGHRAGIDGRSLVAAVAPTDVDVEVREVATINSFELTLPILLGIAQAATGAAREDGVAGVVVTHGTDTLEETAFLTALLHDAPAPIVFTGAQVPADAPDADGPGNLADAIATAARSADDGVVVRFAGRSVPAIGAYKRSTVDPSAFASRGGGGTRPSTGSTRRGTALDGLRALEPRVRLVTSVAGGDGAPIDEAVDAGTRGIVLQAFGLGNVGVDAVRAVRRAIARGVVVVVTSRCVEGPVRRQYGGGGGAVDLVAAGAVLGGDLSGPQARILLMASLADRDGAAAAEVFARVAAKLGALDPQ